ncbi:delta-1-pyrroline-5-carboxylate dehydrogenase, mitochondrial [Rhipicephalus microplus]|nr:delta-1-pyrroline-5-carboxylate dehydrogenase, mitochondrial-like [Rhipicephalus microplus]
MASTVLQRCRIHRLTKTHKRLQLACASRVRCLTFSQHVDEFNVVNEPMLTYLPGSKERQALQDALNELKDTCTEVPIVVGGKEIRTSEARYHTAPFDHSKKVAKYYWASKETIQDAIGVSLKAREEWEAKPLNDKVKLFLRAADLVGNKYRYKLNAATMLGQGKTVFQAEIDSAAELADFLRFNAYFAKELTKYQPISTDPKVTVNHYRQRGLEGFTTAISPFNFSAIGGNLASAPTLMGNVVLWKPSDAAVLSNYFIFKIFEEAGFPPGVINFLPSEGRAFGDVTSASPHLACVNFTGSVATFRTIWKQVSQNLDIYTNFPRLVGECGGKNFHFVHPSADLSTVVAQTTRSGFEYSGQKCSAVERLYVPSSLWPKLKEQLVEAQKSLKLGSPLEFDTFTSAVIDRAAFSKITGYLQHAKNSSNLKVLAGGDSDDSQGFFVQPTILETSDPHDRIMKEEIFGPVYTAYVYPDSEVDKCLALARDTAPFGLTASVFARDEKFLKSACEYLKMTGGNFYVNDKSTGAVVGQQPFGGARISGTNDKAGGPHYLLRFSSAQTIKETKVPLTDIKYPYMTSS